MTSTVVKGKSEGTSPRASSFPAKKALPTSTRKLGCTCKSTSTLLDEQQVLPSFWP
eukprot:CAMPEP_0180783660 /NCGR_PEP_ID=MMETSP1038_2-20121128/49138_1 /TAXON_ID=632150 /ORGANISM="Azadinium spinosum, Strain 3D9" /LENGTH=55 /DNA_ID=CAMNT_0022820235 /DNA_START=35 /DNA_END=198 /DNA_ORIENTATION=-